MKYTKILFAALVVASLTTSSCKKDFFDINQNPNSAVSSNITPDLILPAALTNIGGRVATSYAWLNRWLGYWAPSASWAPAVEENSYNVTTNFAWTTALWSGLYDNIYDLDQMEKKGQASGQDFYQGIGKILKSLNYQMLVDMFNNVPYSKAMDIKNNILPAYDKAEDIYPKLIQEITAGINLIVNADASKNLKLATADIMFHGDPVMWAKFGNTLKLRLLIHMSQVPGFNPAAEIAIINSDGHGFLNAGQTAESNPGYSTDKPNPYWATYGYAKNNDRVNTYDRANNFALNIMKTLNDERYKYFYRAVRAGTFVGQYRGVDYALINADPQYTENNISDIGGNVPNGTNFTGLLKSPTMGTWIITSFESIFLQAEALARGWAINTTYASAQAAYSEGVRESFRWLVVGGTITNANTFAAAYLAQADPRVAWPATQAAQINVILWQKYFAFNGNNPLETWTDYRRIPAVNIPLSLAPRIANAIPVRVQYAQDEYNYNAANVLAQGSINPITSTIFWDR